MNAAIKIFALRGYQYATIEEIASEAGVAKGLVHFYFENKLDVLLSVILLFSKTVADRCTQRLALLNDPVEKLHAIFETFRDIMRQDKKNLYWGHIVREGLPDSDKIKSKKLLRKYREIGKENREMQALIDAIILEGQKQGTIQNGLKPQVMRQILGGASQMLYYGLTDSSRRPNKATYTASDVHTAMTDLIEKFHVKA